MFEIVEGMGITLSEWTKFVEENEVHKASAKKETDLINAKETKNYFIAVAYLETLDKRRYESLLEELQNNCTMKNSKYPQDLTTFYNYMLH